MEENYWLGRRRASAANARSAAGAEARLVHLDLAGRYSVLAAAAAVPAPSAEADSAYYGRLESGARWLAGEAACAEERSEHLGQAERYLRLRLDSAPGGR
ncbi:MAG TPA: hypothetical protein VEA60_03340 [Allosphingosinicella sp.]|nr:hypothetical protein [Allosphingosinicella sp.]